MLNEELATFLLLERTNMQHVERSNDYEVAGGVGSIFESKSAVWKDATQRTETKDLQIDRLERWEEDFARREKRN
jgi:chaperonin cofactor prefoldin